VSRKELIVVGCGQFIQPPGLEDYREVKEAASCREAARILEDATEADLILTDVSLPDGNWCDVLRLVYELRIAAEVRVLGHDGRTVLRLEVKRSGAGSMRCLQSALESAGAAGAVAVGAEEAA
jgi:DNA-binding NarL/FixJ family response regulator